MSTIVFCWQSYDIYYCVTTQYQTSLYKLFAILHLLLFREQSNMWLPFMARLTRSLKRVQLIHTYIQYYVIQQQQIPPRRFFMGGKMGVKNINVNPLDHHVITTITSYIHLDL